MKPLIFSLSLLLAACASQAPAPVQDRGAPIRQSAPAPVQKTSAAAPALAADANYVVKRGDTLYRIALDHGLYYSDLATWNGIGDVNSLREGQVLRLTPPGTTGEAVAVTRPVAATAPLQARPLTPAAGEPPLRTEPRVNKEAYSDAAWEKANAAGGVTAQPAAKPAEAPAAQKAVETPAEKSVAWRWPTAGNKVLSGFGVAGNKGVDLAGKAGDPVLAAADGRVYLVAVHKGYGNLLVIGHADGFISVYAHNRKILVKEKDNVVLGQKVAEMGNSDSENGVFKLHFEIRKQGKPVDPMLYLPKT